MKHCKSHVVDKHLRGVGAYWLIAASLAFSLLMSVPVWAVEGQSFGEPASRDVQIESGLGPLPGFNHVGPGADFVKVGATTRIYNTLDATASQTEPFDIIVPALPAGAVLVRTFISWNFLLNGAPPAADTIFINGNLIRGVLVGSGSPDLCWGKDGAASYKYEDFNNLVGPGPVPVVVNVANATDKVVGADPNAYGEGLSILVVYEIPGSPLRNVDVYWGYTSNLSNPAGSYAEAILKFTTLYTCGDLHFFTNALDGQTSPDSFLINGTNVGGLVAGTSAISDAWIGLLGPSVSGINNLYDHANDDVSAFVPAPAPDMTIRTQFINDCIGHSFAAVSFCLNGKTMIDPDTMYYFEQNAINPENVCIFVGAFCDCPTDGVDSNSFVVNGNILPDSVEYLPGNIGSCEAWKLYVSKKKFIQNYGDFLDWDVYDYHVTGSFIDDICDPFDLTGQVTLRGHVAGDVDMDGEVSVSDLTYLISYLFNGGAAPPFQPTVDLDKDGRITVADLSMLVQMLFFE